MLGAFTLFLLFQLIGEVVARGLSLTVPGPVIGMILLTAALLIWVRFRPNLAETAVAKTSAAMLGSLGVLFVPAGVGIIDQLGLLGTHAVAIVVTILASSVLTMLATVGTFLMVKRLMGRSS